MRFWAVILVAAFAAELRADILHLRSGVRHYGTIVSQTEREVVFRVWLAEGSTAVQTFRMADVAKVEHCEIDRPPMSAPAPAAIEPDTGSSAHEDFEQMLREAFELLDDGDTAAALRALQRIVIRAPEADLPALSEQA